LPPVTIDAARARALAKILVRSKQSYSAWVRRQIDEHM
jgi:hypothetical protein